MNNYQEIVDCSAEKIDFIISQYVHKKADREILRLKWLDEITYREIAEITGMSVRGVQYVVSRNRKKLLKYFL